MDFLILDQAASGSASAAQENPYSGLIMMGLMVLMIVVMYLVVIRPSRKKQKEDEEMRSSMEIGDDVTTIGGIVGKVISIREDDETFILETGSDKTRVRFKKWAVRSIDTPEKQPKAEEKKSKAEKKEKSEDEE